MEHTLSNAADRLTILFLIAALGCLSVVLVGILAEVQCRHLAYQANTIRHRRVLSFFRLGRNIIARNEDANLTPAVLKIVRPFIEQASQI